MIAASLFMLIFLLVSGGLYIFTFCLFLPALHAQGFPQDAALESKTDFFRLYEGRAEKHEAAFPDRAGNLIQAAPLIAEKNFSALYREIEERLGRKKQPFRLFPKELPPSPDALLPPLP